MKILVTGATGFVGSALTRQLLAGGAEVRILRRATSRMDLLGDAAANVEHVVGDVTDPASVHDAMQNITHVYHTAATIIMGGPQAGRHQHHVNVYGTACIVNAALHTGVKRLVHTSSIAALGRRDEPVMTQTEHAVWRDTGLQTPYAVSKHLAELEIHRGIAEGLDAVMVNPSLIFGPGRSGENTMLLAERVRNGRVPAVPIGGINVVDVEDVAAGHIKAMARGRIGERYILGSENLLWKEILETLAAALGVAPPTRRFQPRLALGFATVLEAWSLVTRKAPELTRTLARNISQVSRYSNSRATQELGCAFRPFAKTAQRIATAIVGSAAA